ncbi:MAG: hypothetical protein KIT79_08565 [Deltaproteobacteria bacterium]|nr:hypothetical protein [Deltaproteobacteria bacterium]
MAACPPGYCYVYAFPVFFVILWIGIFHVVARVGGWRPLAERYRARLEPMRAETFRMQSGRLGRWCGYNNCLTVKLASAGLYIAMPWIFGFGHEPLLIPWDRLKVVSRGRTFGVAFTQFELTDPPGFLLLLADRVIDKARELGYVKDDTGKR